MSTIQDSAISLPPTVNPEEYEAAYREVAAEIMAVPDAELVPITLDVTTVVTIGLGAAPKIEAFESELAKLPVDNAANLPRRVRATALALMYTHGYYQAAVEPQGPFAERLQRGQELRTKFAADIQAMITRGVVDPKAMDDYRGTVGYKVLANDLTIAVQVIQNHWSQVAGHTFVTEAEIGEARRLITLLLSDIGERDQTPLSASQVALTRQRAFTLFVNTYAQARRCIQFVRFEEEDADTIAPSLYSGRGNGNHRTSEDAAETPAADPGGTTPPTAADAAPSAGAAGATVAVATPATTVGSAAAVATAPPSPAANPTAAPATNAASVNGPAGNPFTP